MQIYYSDILAEFHQPRSSIELVVDKMPLPQYGYSFSTGGLYSLADISARSLHNRIHHTIYFPEGISLFSGRSKGTVEVALSNPDGALLKLCEELNHQLETWYQSLPELIRPDLSGEPKGNGHAGILRLRYWSAKHNIYRPFLIYATSSAADAHTSMPPVVMEGCASCLAACRMFLSTAGYVLAERTCYTFSTLQW